MEAAHRPKLVELIRRHARVAFIGAEIGVSNGKTSELLLRTFPKMVLVMVDTWMPPAQGSPYWLTGDTCARATREQQDDRYATAMHRTQKYQERRIVLRMPSTIAARHKDAPMLDFCFVDDDHSYEGCKASLEAWWPKVKDGGLFAAHDYGKPDKPGVTKAVDEFFGRLGLPFHHDETSVCWLVKSPNA